MTLHNITKQANTKDPATAATFLAAFIFWTLAITTIDVQPIGPNGSEVGFATINDAFRQHIGTNLSLYVITDWLSLIPLACMLGFALLGFSQLVARKSLLKVDRSLLALGVFYAALLTAYIGFDILALNYRPVLIDGALEPSYPSSTTLLVLGVMPTASMLLKNKLPQRKIHTAASAILIAFTAFMVAARLVSGVHWLTDIAGGMLLAASLVMAYRGIAFPEN